MIASMSSKEKSKPGQFRLEGGGIKGDGRKGDGGIKGDGRNVDGDMTSDGEDKFSKRHYWLCV